MPATKSRPSQLSVLRYGAFVSRTAEQRVSSYAPTVRKLVHDHFGRRPLGAVTIILTKPRLLLSLANEAQGEAAGVPENTWKSVGVQQSGFVHEFRPQMSMTSGGTRRLVESMFTRTGGTRRHSATAPWRTRPPPVASAFALVPNRAADGASPVTPEVLPVLVNIRRGRCLPNCCRNAALRREQSQQSIIGKPNDFRVATVIAPKGAMWMLINAPKMRDPKQLKLSLLRGFVEVDQLIRSGARERRVAWVRHEMNVNSLSKRQANKLQAQILVDGAEAERITADLARRL
jgi:hypothetical protein